VETEPIDLADVRQRIRANEASLNGFFAERGPEIRGLTVASLTGTHVWLYGLPGVAKTLLFNCAVAQFDGSSGDYLFSAQTTIDEVIAARRIKEYIAGDPSAYTNQGLLSSREFALLDEGFKCNSGTLNGCLAWLNERRLPGGMTSPLVSAVLCSNEPPADKSLAPLRDRLQQAFIVEPLGRDEKIALLRRVKAGARFDASQLAPVSEAERLAVQAAIKAMPIDDSVDVALADLAETLDGMGIYVSDRLLVAALDILRGYAWLEGRTAVLLDGLEPLQHVLWNVPEEKPAVQAALAALSKGLVGDIRLAVDAALAESDVKAALAGTVDRGTGNAALSTLEACGRSVKGMVEDYPKGHAVLDRAGEYLAELASAYRAVKANVAAGADL